MTPSEKRQKRGELMLCIICVILIFLVTSCSGSKAVATYSTVDSTHVEVNKRIITIYDTVYVSIPKDSIVVVTRDSVNIIETEVGTSIVKLNDDGSYEHSLIIRDTVYVTPIEIETEVTDTTTTRVIATNNTEVVTEKESSHWVLKWGFIGAMIVIALLAIALIKNA